MTAKKRNSVPPYEAGADHELTDEEQGAFEAVVDYYGSGFDRDIPDDNRLAHWWNEFLRGPLRNVRIGTDEFRRSRAGLIPFCDLLDLAEYAGVVAANMGTLSLIELLELVAAKAGRSLTAPCGSKAQSGSTLDSDRLRFYETQKAANPRLTYKAAAELWNKKERDYCDEGSFRQSCYRARKT